MEEALPDTRAIPRLPEVVRHQDVREAIAPPFYETTLQRAMQILNSSHRGESHVLQASSGSLQNEGPGRAEPEEIVTALEALI